MVNRARGWECLPDALRPWTHGSKVGGSRPNDCRISCNAASHATETAARFVRRLEDGLAESAPPGSADCESRPLGRRANKRRVVSFLQGLAGAYTEFVLRSEFRGGIWLGL